MLLRKTPAVPTESLLSRVGKDVGKVGGALVTGVASPRAADLGYVRDLPCVRARRRRAPRRV